MTKNIILDVDTGSLCFCNIQYLEEYGATAFDKGEIILLEKGKHEISIDIPDTWDGPVHKKFNIDVETESQFYFGDLCYCFSELHYTKWHKFLDKTNYMESPKYRKIRTGGDGAFAVGMTILSKGRCK